MTRKSGTQVDLRAALEAAQAQQNQAQVENAAEQAVAEAAGNGAGGGNGEKVVAPATRKPAGGDTVYQLVQRMTPQIARALPKHLDPDRMARIILTTLRQNPALLSCTKESLLGAIMLCAQLGLEPGPLGHVHLVPFRDGKTGARHVQVIIDYKGYIELARRSGQILSIQARPVYQNDLFRIRFGLNEELEHIPWYMREDQQFSEAGPLRGVYLVVRYKDGGHLIDYMPVQEIEEHRKRSKSPDQGPWVTDYVMMALKTVVRRNWRWLPISVEYAQLDRLDEARTVGVQDTEPVLEADFTVVDAETEQPANQAGADA